MAQRSLPSLPVWVFVLAAAAWIWTAEAGEQPGKDHYLGIQLNYLDPDSGRRGEGSGVGATFLYGRDLSGPWSLEYRFSGFVLESGPGIRTDFYQQDLGVDAVYRFAPFNGWTPFALGGLSVIRNDVDLEELDDTSLGAAVGGGITGVMSERLGLKWRFDLRYVHDGHQSGQQDIRLGAGIQIPLGRSRPASRGANPEADADRDTIEDVFDRCPFSLRGATVNEFGCMYGGQTLRLPDVDFRNGTAILTPEAREELGKVVLALRSQPDLRIRVIGHTDSTGSAAMNQELSLERAEAVATYLVLQGVSTQRLSTDGRGQSEPIADNGTREGRARNRRIEIQLLEPDAL